MHVIQYPPSLRQDIESWQLSIGSEQARGRFLQPKTSRAILSMVVISVDTMPVPD